MRGTITLKILQAISKTGMDAIALCESIIVAGYGASYSQIQKVYESKTGNMDRMVMNVPETKHYKQNYQKLLSKLKREGLIAVKTDFKSKHFFITPRGRVKLSALEARWAGRFPPINYRRTRRRHHVIVAFDIPAIESRKRDWLREVLKHLGLKMVQRSVWVGSWELPEEFLEDLRILHIVDCVEIFEVGKSGTLKHLI